MDYSPLILGNKKCLLKYKKTLGKGLYQAKRLSFQKKMIKILRISYVVIMIIEGNCPNSLKAHFLAEQLRVRCQDTDFQAM